MADFRLGLGWLPALIIEAADEHWQLSDKMNRVLGPYPVPEGVQSGPEQLIGIMAIRCRDARHQILKPEIGLLNGCVENVETRRHDCILPQKLRPMYPFGPVLDSNAEFYGAMTYIKSAG